MVDDREQLHHAELRIGSDGLQSEQVHYREAGPLLSPAQLWLNTPNEL